MKGHRIPTNCGQQIALSEVAGAEVRIQQFAQLEQLKLANWSKQPEFVCYAPYGLCGGVYGGAPQLAQFSTCLARFTSVSDHFRHKKG